MIEHAETLGEHVEDPLLLYSVLYGFFIPKFMNFDGDAACALARQFLALAVQQKATAPIMIGHRLLGNTLLCMGDFAEGLYILTALGRFTTRPRIGRWRRDLAMMWERLP